MPGYLPGFGLVSVSLSFVMGMGMGKCKYVYAYLRISHFGLVWRRSLSISKDETLSAKMIVFGIWELWLVDIEWMGWLFGVYMILFSVDSFGVSM